MTEPSDFAEYYYTSATWEVKVSDELDHDSGTLISTRNAAYQSLKTNRTSVRPSVAQSISKILMADSAWFQKLSLWLPWEWEMALKASFWPLRRRLHQISKKYHEGEMGNLFSSPTDVMKQEILTQNVSEDREKAALAIGLLHIEWYEYVLELHNGDYNEGFLKKAFSESANFFSGNKCNLPNQFKQLQRTLFSWDKWWLLEIINIYNINSIALRRALKAVDFALNDLLSS